jgi:L-methionine (R)-S-oxide reductase|tara:strand:+ start:2451 stop:2903 length:453 start_codon:yes stop_codon:yes gene_type:complete
MYKSALINIKKIINDLDFNSSLGSICDYLKKNIHGYDWVGFYFHDKLNKKIELKAFSGLPTEHTKIPFGKGICGQTAKSNKHMIVSDVSKESNYISCNINVKSEIVVPLFLNNINIGQIDIDSKAPNRFSKVDLDFLTKINELVSKKLIK